MPAAWAPNFHLVPSTKHPLRFPVRNLVRHDGQQRLVQLRRKVIPAFALLLDVLTMEEMVDSELVP